MRILVAEDNFVVAMEVSASLRERGQTVAVSNSYTAAMEVLAGEIPDVAIVDLTLHDGHSGKLLVRSLSERGIPVVITSGSTMMRQHKEKLPMVAYLEKPCDPQRLLKMVEGLAQRKKTTRQ